MPKFPGPANLIGIYLKKIREARGHSLKEVIELLARHGFAISLGQLSKIENGKRKPTVEHLLAAAECFEIPAQWFADIARVPELEVSAPETLDPIAIRVRGDEATRRGDYREACSEYSQAIAAATSDPALRTVALGAVVSRAYAFAKIGLSALAEMEIRRVLDETKAELRARAGLTMAVILSDRGEQTMSWIWAREAEAWASRAARNSSLHARTLMSLAERAARIGSYDTAVETARKARQMFRRIGLGREVAQAELNIASYEIRRGNVERGIAALRRQIVQLKEDCWLRLEALAEADLGEALLRIGNWEDGLDHLDRSDAIARRPADAQADILFHNAHHRRQAALQLRSAELASRMWQRMVRLRKQVTRAMPEAISFDRERKGDIA